jgi:RNA polymerase sigma-70 factor (ECF subfamily)
MSSSFPTARFPALPLGKEKEGADPLYKDATGASEELSDQTLIAQICGNDDEALNLLFKRYSRLVWNIARRILGDSAEAEDVMQEVFLLIHQKPTVFDPAKGAPRTLIVYMTYQSACKRRRYLNGRHSHYSWRLNESVATSPVVTASFFDESIEAHFGKEGLRNAIAELSRAQRQTLRLYFFEGYALDEIASKLGQSLGNIRHHYFRGLERLRKHLKAVASG